MSKRILLFSLLFFLSSAAVSPIWAAEPEVVPRQVIVVYKAGQTPGELTGRQARRNTRQQTFFGRLQNFAEHLSDRLSGEPSLQAKLTDLSNINQQFRPVQSRRLFRKNISTTIFEDMVLVTHATDIPITTLIRRYQSASFVKSVEPNYVLRAQTVPNDVYYPNQWNLGKLDMEHAWDLNRGSTSVTVAILDTGIDFSHPDLPTSNLINGYDFFNNDADATDDYGHGTSVAGIVGAATNNNLGISGVNWDVKIMGVKVLDASGNGNTALFVEGIDYAVNHGARIINLSLGTFAPCNIIQSLQTIIDYADLHAVTVVAAAGNSNIDAADFSPASCNHVLAVGATGTGDERADYSNFGTTVDISAPGGNGTNTAGWIMSTALGTGFIYTKGTSASAPHVAGVAALLLAIKPSLTPAELTQILIDHADPIITDQPIGRRLNAYQALAAVANSSPTPTISPSPMPTASPLPSPVYTLNDLKSALDNYLGSADNLYFPVDGKINMLDIGFIINYLH